MDIGSIFAISSIVISTLGYIAQLWKTYNDKSGQNLSDISMFCMVLLNLSTAFYYYYLKGFVGMVGCIIGVVLVIMNVSLKYYYHLKKKNVIPSQSKIPDLHSVELF